MNHCLAIASLLQLKSTQRNSALLSVVVPSSAYSAVLTQMTRTNTWGKVSLCFISTSTSINFRKQERRSKKKKGRRNGYRGFLAEREVVSFSYSTGHCGDSDSNWQIGIYLYRYRVSIYVVYLLIYQSIQSIIIYQNLIIIMFLSSQFCTVQYSTSPQTRCIGYPSPSSAPPNVKSDTPSGYNSPVHSKG